MKNKKQYELLINARNFHYDNFNKWMTFFYVAIGAIFVGYYSIINEKGLFFEQIVILSVGLLVSLFWHWSCKGYYYWITNFIQLIQIYEKNYPPKKRVYYCMANKNNNNKYYNPISGANISTSKVTLLFSFIVTLTWTILITNKVLLITNSYCLFGNISIIFYLITIIITYLLLISIPFLFLQSDVSGYPELIKK